MLGGVPSPCKRMMKSQVLSCKRQNHDLSLKTPSPFKRSIRHIQIDQSRNVRQNQALWGIRTQHQAPFRLFSRIRAVAWSERGPRTNEHKHFHQFNRLQWQNRPTRCVKQRTQIREIPPNQQNWPEYFPEGLNWHNPISLVPKRVVFQKGGFGGCSPGTKTGTRLHSDVPPEPKTGTRVHLHVPPEREPERGHIRQNHPFIETALLSTLDNWKAALKKLFSKTLPLSSKAEDASGRSTGKNQYW